MCGFKNTASRIYDQWLQGITTKAAWYLHKNSHEDKGTE
jgi:hypothetical protein